MEALFSALGGLRYLGLSSTKLCKKLKVLKGPLRTLNWMHFAHTYTRAEMGREKLEWTQEMFHDSPTDQEVQEQARSMRKMSWNLSEAERKFYFQKAKCRYIINSDQSTKLFYAAVERNAKKKHILVVVKEDGTVTTSAEEVVGEFLAFYQELIGTFMAI